ncbi:MAG: iron-sulfur cluster assembly accessory protein [Calothrix sp. MO_167.B42]|nr:iron-sulfur cluster assembly accessory protein [Calothrix sp. MO_167.B42]
MIQISQAAAKEIRRLMFKQQISNNCCRLAVKPGGCNDLFYDLSFNNREIGNSDRTFDCDDIQVIIDSESLNYVKDLKLDYSEDLIGGAFRFYNPQASVTCGCGNSFSLTKER